MTFSTIWMITGHNEDTIAHRPFLKSMRRRYDQLFEQEEARGL